MEYKPYYNLDLLEKLVAEDDSTYEGPAEEETCGEFDFTLAEFGLPMKNANFTIMDNIHFLNHGSFGAAPRAVQKAQQHLRDLSERQLVEWYQWHYPRFLAHATRQLAKFIHCNPKDLAWVPNATTGVLSVIQSINWKPGDSLVHLQLGYGPIIKFLKYYTAKLGIELITAKCSVPVNMQQLYTSFAQAIKPTTKLALVDHITSSTGLLLPVKQFIDLCKSKNVQILIDGAHAIGQIPLDVTELDADYYVSNLHKWLYAAKGCAFLWVNPKHYGTVHPVVVGDGLGYSQLSEFSWPGTSDFTPWISSIAAIKFYNSCSGEAIRKYCHELAVWAGNMLKEAWATNFALEADSCDSDAIANMVSIRAPVKKTFNSFDEAREYALWLNHTLWRKYRVEVPCTVLNETQIYIRISAQIYNTKEDFYALRDASLEICA